MPEKNRDRWENSSESSGDEKDIKQKKRNGNYAEKKKKEKEDCNATTRLPVYNPLLAGCRSVYDTYEQVKALSEGSYGVVWKARDLATDEIVALKQIKFDPELTKEGFPVTALREWSVLLAMCHENVVMVREIVLGKGFDKVYMVMEFMEFDLKEGIHKFTGALAQSDLKGIIQQILAGMHHMHDKWLLHRDMKTSNVLVHLSGRVCICDFGLARSYQQPLQELTQLVVTLWYRSPELLFGETRYGPAIDMWSIGCIFAELICKESVLQGLGELDQIDKIFSLVGVPTEDNWPLFQKLPSANIFGWKNRKRGELEIFRRFPVNAPVSSTQAFLDSNGFDLLQKLLTLDPARRISAQQALEHNYFKEGVQPKTPSFFVEYGNRRD